MKVVIKYDGQTYESAEADGSGSFEELVEGMYDGIEKMLKFQVQLQDGSVMILGSEACKRAVFLIVP